VPTITRVTSSPYYSNGFSRSSLLTFLTALEASMAEGLLISAADHNALLQAYNNFSYHVHTVTDLDFQSYGIDVADTESMTAITGGILGASEVTSYVASEETITAAGVNEIISAINGIRSHAHQTVGEAPGEPEPEPEPEPDEEHDYEIVLSANENNFNLRSRVISMGWNGTDVVSVICTIATGVVIGSTNISIAAFTVGSFPAGSNIEITVSSGAAIVGKGGNGGTGSSAYTGHGDPGQNGGPALNTTVPIFINNLGTIAGGGGGGGGGSGSGDDYGTVPGGGGGGGGAGVLAGSGGAGGTNAASGASGGGFV